MKTTHKTNAGIGINGGGVIGREFIRRLILAGKIELLKVVNDPLVNAEVLAGLLFYGEFYGTLVEHDIRADGKGKLIINGHEIVCTQTTNPAEVPWNDTVVVESSGYYVGSEENPDSWAGHFQGGARYVLVTAPTKGGIPVPVMHGVSDLAAVLDPERKVFAQQSCTTTSVCCPLNALANFPGVELEWATLETVHAPTATDKTMDFVGANRKKPGEVVVTRGLCNNGIYGPTGAAKAVALIVPAFKDKFGGAALRVNTLDTGSESMVQVNLAEPVNTNDLKDAIIADCEASPGFKVFHPVGGVEPTLKQVRGLAAGGVFLPHTWTESPTGKNIGFHTDYDNTGGYVWNALQTLLAMLGMGVEA